MTDAGQILRIAGEWLARGERICVATIVKREGSAPREVGAKMVISLSGKLAGSVGGGAVEQEVVRRAKQVIESGTPMMFDADLSGRSGELDAVCGGRVSVFLESFGESKNLFIIGAGHVGTPLAVLAAEVGFAVTLVDDREEYLKRDHLGESVKTVKATPEDFEPRLRIDQKSFVVICTRGHKLDKEWLERIVVLAPRYIGMLGSKHKAQSIFDELKSQGVSGEQLSGIHTPVGLDIGALTPQEIAVSITAELISEWRRGRGSKA